MRATREIAPQLLSRIDDSPDPLFYAQPRFVHHIDHATIEALTSLYRERLPAGAELLDLMSSWVSHLPPEARYSRVAGLGMNHAELTANSQLTDRVVHDLNANPVLPYETSSFDAVLLAVSVQYLIRPIEIFREIGRVLRASGEALVAVSHRSFPSKAIALFRSAAATDRPQIVAAYFRAAGGFAEPILLDRSPPGPQPIDPLWVVAGRGRDRPADA
jgi:SAM-dependent methyltransferase